MQVIIFPNETGGVSVIVPATDFVDQLQELAERCVPFGKPWRILDSTSLPPQDSRDKWLWTESGSLDVAPEPTEQ